jgi:hypothetical protein
MSAEIILDRGHGTTVELDDFEKALMNEVELTPSRPAPAPRKKPMVPTFKRQAPAPMRDDIDVDAFANPNKSRGPSYPMGQPDEDQFGDEEFPMDEGDEEQFQHQGGQPQVPSAGFATIEDEKAALLTKIERLKKKGVASVARLTGYSDIEEIRTEFKRMMYSIEVEQSTKFARRMLVACCTGIEFMNKRFDPFDVQLDGWSETIMENLDDYDDVFEELHNKYKTKVQMAPELKLVMMVGGSAMMFHLTNSMFKSAFPSMNQVVKQNPDLVKNMVEAISKTTNGGQGPQLSTDGRQEMRGPGIDLSALLGGFMGPPPPMSSQARPEPTRTQIPIVDDSNDGSMSDIVSIISGDGTTKDITTSATRKRRTKKKEVTI